MWISCANRHIADKTMKRAANTKRGAKIAHTMRCRLIKLTEMHELTVSSNWKNTNQVQICSLWATSETARTKIQPMISHPKVLKNRDIPAVMK